MPLKKGDKVRFINWEKFQGIGLNTFGFSVFPERFITRKTENKFTIDDCVNFGEDEYSLNEFPFLVYGEDIELLEVLGEY